MSSKMESLDVADKIRQILRDAASNAHDPAHHFGAPFLSPYQIAIKFKEQHPNDAQAIHANIGGKGSGEHTSLAQQLARYLSGLCKNDPNGEIEGAFLYRENLKTLQYQYKEDTIEASLGQSWDMSIFRIRPGHEKC